MSRWCVRALTRKNSPRFELLARGHDVVAVLARAAVACVVLVRAVSGGPGLLPPAVGQEEQDDHGHEEDDGQDQQQAAGGAAGEGAVGPDDGDHDEPGQGDRDEELPAQLHEVVVADAHQGDPGGFLVFLIIDTLWNELAIRRYIRKIKELEDHEQTR